VAARLKADSCAAVGIRLIDPRQQRIGRRGGEQLGVRSRDEALVGRDRHHLAARLVNHQQPEAGALGCGFQRRLDRLLLRQCRGGEEQEGEEEQAFEHGAKVCPST
jgi:hypothetical protein